MLQINSVVKIINTDIDKKQYKNKITLVTEIIDSENVLLYIDRSLNKWSVKDLKDLDDISNQQLRMAILSENINEFWKKESGDNNASN